VCKEKTYCILAGATRFWSAWFGLEAANLIASAKSLLARKEFLKSFSVFILCVVFFSKMYDKIRLTTSPLSVTHTCDMVGRFGLMELFSQSDGLGILINLTLGRITLASCNQNVNEISKGLAQSL